jgi:hypothetical protein
MVGVEGAKYLGYKTGIDQRLADIYAGGRVLQQTFREYSGIAGFSNFFEQLFPGLNFGVLGATAALGAGISVLERTGRFSAAGAVAGVIYGMVGGPGVGQSAQELKEEYTGERKVPVRKSAWWALGYQPFIGGQISHYAPSWYVRMKEQPYKTNVYGSEAKYWERGTFLPTFENLFHIKTVMDPYWLDRRNYASRPYPITTPLGEEIPVFGPLIADTIGSIIKPRIRMHEEYIRSEGMTATANISNRGVPADIAQRLGIPAVPLAGIEMNRPDITQDRLEKYANIALEPTGIWKFALGYFGVKFDENYRIAEGGVQASRTRAYYDMGIGGALGQTEFIRRFMLSEYGRPSKLNMLINPIPNALPRWLPGSLSEHERDRTYFRDFSRGDPYTKLQGGEYRLPGKGYEAVNPLHSGEPGVYDAVDRLLIMADIAPFSQAYFAAKRDVSRMRLTPFWRRQVRQAEENRKRRLDKYGFIYGAAGSQDNLSAANWNPAFKAVRNSYNTLNQEVLSEIPLLGSKIFPKRDPLDHYIKFQVEGETFANWEDAYRSIVRPAVYDVLNEDPVTAVIKGAMLAGAVTGSLPFTQIAKYLNPIQALANPQSGKNMLVAGAVLGGASASARMAVTGNITGGVTPLHIEKERAALEYFDKLEYAKYNALAGQAYAVGDNELGKKMEQRARKTTTYGIGRLRETGSVEPYKRTLNSTERSYFEAFLTAPIGKRASIMKVVPDHMREALAAAYGQPTSQVPIQEEVREYLQEHGMPAADWIGWHPEVPDDVIRIKSIQGGINNLANAVHRFNYYPSQKLEARTRYDYVTPAYPEVYPDDGMAWLKDTFTNNNSFSMGTGPRTEVGVYNITDNRKDEIFYFLNDIR